MEFSEVVKAKIKLTEETLNKKLGGTWKIDEIALLGQCRAVNEKNESVGPIGLEFGILKVDGDKIDLITPIDQKELLKRSTPTPDPKAAAEAVPAPALVPAPAPEAVPAPVATDAPAPAPAATDASAPATPPAVDPATATPAQS